MAAARRSVLAFRSPAAVGLFLGLTVVLLGADLALKRWSFASWPRQSVDVHRVVQGRERLPLSSAELIPSVLALKLALNRGAVFGLWAGQRWLFVLASVVALGVIGWYFAASRRGQWVFHAALAMVLAGALGNLYDRVVFGAVRDMLWLFPGVELPFELSWPGGSQQLYPWIFNAADAFLLIGIVLIVIRSVVVEVQRSARRSEPAGVSEDEPRR